MITAATKPISIEEYKLLFSKEVQQILEDIRNTIQQAAPNAEETISYNIPTFTLHGNLVHFGAFKNHIGFYPTPTATAKFKKELSFYEGAKGSIKFPLDEPMPLDLMTKIVKYRIKENLQRAAEKSKKKKQNVVK